MTSPLEMRECAKELRRNLTECERILWSKLSRRQLAAKFSRQIAIGGTIADFCCRARRLIVEVDGDSHDAEADARRDAYRAGLGYRTVRVQNHEVRSDLYGVLERIEHELDRPPLPLPEERGKE